MKGRLSRFMYSHDQQANEVVRCEPEGNVGHDDGSPTYLNLDKNNEDEAV